MLFDKVLILSIVIVISASISDAFIYKNENSDNFIGEKCLTKNKEAGYCQEFLKCKSAQKLYDSKRIAEIAMCKSPGKIAIVCCPSTPKKYFTSKPPKPIKNASSKFQKALCKNAKADIKIDIHLTNGNKADVGEFPFQAALGYKSENGYDIDFNCGGSLIADDIILTAAHCVNKKFDQPVMVRLGRTSLDLTDRDDQYLAQDIKIESIKIHPEYRRLTRQNDIALIKLKEPASLSNSVDTICLSTKDDISSEELTITGFGRTSVDNHEKSVWLLKGKVNEYPLEKCKELFGVAGITIVDSQFCAINDQGVDACQGDSGGPLFYEHNNIYYLQAITSFGNSCGGAFPSVYSRITKFLDWIEEEMFEFEFRFRNF